MAKVVVAPASFKGFASARAAATAIAEGVRRAGHEPVALPLADGGEGTLDALAGSPGARIRWTRATDPLGRPRRARFLFWPRRRDAFVELAEAAGWGRVRRSPATIWDRSTYGVGLIVRRCLALGARRITLGLGGSATNDGGAGFLSALGALFLDAGGNPLPPTPRHFPNLHKIELGPCLELLAGVHLEYLADVDNPLLGPEGATLVFARQKGARPRDLPCLEDAMRRYAEVLSEACHRDLARLPFSGAAGGTGAALLALGARPRPGARAVAERLRLRSHLQGAALLITGEGRLDVQTLHGKAPLVAVAEGRRQGVPIVMLVGQPGPNLLADYGVVLFPVTSPEMARPEIRARLPTLLAEKAEAACRLLIGEVQAEGSAGRSRPGGPRP